MRSEIQSRLLKSTMIHRRSETSRKFIIWRRAVVTANLEMMAHLTEVISGLRRCRFG